MAASNLGRADVVEILLAKGADPSVINIKGKTALDLAKKRDHKRVVALLEKAVKGQ